MVIIKDMASYLECLPCGLKIQGYNHARVVLQRSSLFATIKLPIMVEVAAMLALHRLNKPRVSEDVKSLGRNSWTSTASNTNICLGHFQNTRQNGAVVENGKQNQAIQPPQTCPPSFNDALRIFVVEPWK